MMWPASVTERLEAASSLDGLKPAVSIRWLKASSTHLLSPDMAPILPSRISLLYPDVCRGVRRSLLWNDIHATQKPVSVSIARCLPGANMDRLASSRLKAKLFPSPLLSTSVTMISDHWTLTSEPSANRIAAMQSLRLAFFALSQGSKPSSALALTYLLSHLVTYIL